MRRGEKRREKAESRVRRGGLPAGQRKKRNRGAARQEERGPKG